MIVWAYYEKEGLGRGEEVYENDSGLNIRTTRLKTVKNDMKVKQLKEEDYGNRNK